MQLTKGQAAFSVLIHKPADAFWFVEGEEAHRRYDHREGSMIRWIKRRRSTKAGAGLPSGYRRSPETAFRSSGWPTEVVSTRTSPPTWGLPLRRPELAQRLPPGWPRCPAALQGERGPAALAPEVRRWVIEGPAEQGLDGPIGATPNWPTTCTERVACGPVGRPCSGSASVRASALLAELRLPYQAVDRRRADPQRRGARSGRAGLGLNQA